MNNIKTVPVWKDYVQSYFNASLFWHNMWVDNGRPHTGVLADLRCKTRAKYHHVCKMDAHIMCDKMAEAILKKYRSLNTGPLCMACWSRKKIEVSKFFPFFNKTI